MTREDAIKIIHRLDAAFTYTQKLDENYVRDEYIKTLESVSSADCNEVLDNMIMSNRKELALPGELLEACRIIEAERKVNQKVIEPDGTCYVCENKGFVLHENQYHCEYVLYCTECEKGKEFQYDGRQLKKDKTDYFIEPVTKYFDIEELKAKNMFKSHKIAPCPEELKQQLKKIGARL